MSYTVTVRTVQGKDFRVGVDDSSTVGSVKATLATMTDTQMPDIPIARQLLIWRGKILSEEQRIMELGIHEREGQFIVLMLTTARAPPPPAIADTPAPVPPSFSAVVAAAAAAAGPAFPPSPPLFQALRMHPHFPALRATIRQNPASLGQIIQALAQSSPELVMEINANEAEFIHLLSEPDVDDGEDYEYEESEDGDYEDEVEDEVNMRNEMDLLRTIAGLPPDQQVQVAASMGISPERVAELMAMLSTLSEEELEDLLHPEEDGMEGDEGHDSAEIDPSMFSAPELEAIGRLQSLGFEFEVCMQAFLSCDRDEGLAANYLLDGGDDDF